MNEEVTGHLQELTLYSVELVLNSDDIDIAVLTPVLLVPDSSCFVVKFCEGDSDHVIRVFDDDSNPSFDDSLARADLRRDSPVLFFGLPMGPLGVTGQQSPLSGPKEQVLRTSIGSPNPWAEYEMDKVLCENNEEYLSKVLLLNLMEKNRTPKPELGIKKQYLKR